MFVHQLQALPSSGTVKQICPKLCRYRATSWYRFPRPLQLLEPTVKTLGPALMMWIELKGDHAHFRRGHCHALRTFRHLLRAFVPLLMRASVMQS